MKLIACSKCGEFHYKTEQRCPHCNTLNQVLQDGLISSTRRTFAPNAILLGLALTGCGDKTEDTSADTASEPTTEPTSEPTSEPAIENDYGVPDTGQVENEM